MYKDYTKRRPAGKLLAEARITRLCELYTGARSAWMPHQALRDCRSALRPAWVDPLMRFGYAARGVVYVLVGALAFIASVEGGRTPDSKSALGTLLQMPSARCCSRSSRLGCWPSLPPE